MKKPKNTIDYLNEAIEKCKADIQYYKDQSEKALFLDVSAKDIMDYHTGKLKDKNKIKRVQANLNRPANYDGVEIMSKAHEYAAHLECTVLGSLHNFHFSQQHRDDKRRKG